MSDLSAANDTGYRVGFRDGQQQARADLAAHCLLAIERIRGWDSAIESVLAAIEAESSEDRPLRHVPHHGPTLAEIIDKETQTLLNEFESLFGDNPYYIRAVVATRNRILKAISGG